MFTFTVAPGKFFAQDAAVFELVRSRTCTSLCRCLGRAASCGQADGRPRQAAVASLVLEFAAWRSAAVWRGVVRAFPRLAGGGLAPRARPPSPFNPPGPAQPSASPLPGMGVWWGADAVAGRGGGGGRGTLPTRGQRGGPA